MKRIKLSVWSIMVLCLSLALVSCGDDDHKNDHHGMRTGIHKIVVEQSGNTEDFEVNLVFGATNVNGPARLYDENGEYLGDSYSVGKMKSNAKCSITLHYIFADILCLLCCTVLSSIIN